MEPFQFWRSWTCLRREHSQQSQQLPLGRAGTWRFPCLSNDVAIMIFFLNKALRNRSRQFWAQQAPDFEGHDPLHAKIDLLQQLPRRPVVDIQVCPIVALKGETVLHLLQQLSQGFLGSSHPFHMFHVESLEEAPWVTPLRWDHDVVVWLVPEVIPDSCKITNRSDKTLWLSQTYEGELITFFASSLRGYTVQRKEHCEPRC